MKSIWPVLSAVLSEFCVRVTSDGTKTTVKKTGFTTVGVVSVLLDLKGVPKAH